MAEIKTTTSRDRTNFSKIRTAIQIPNLIEVQKNSYERFLQMNMLLEEPLVRFLLDLDEIRDLDCRPDLREICSLS